MIVSYDCLGFDAIGCEITLSQAVLEARQKEKPVHINLLLQLSFVQSLEEFAHSLWQYYVCEVSTLASFLWPSNIKLLTQQVSTPFFVTVIWTIELLWMHADVANQMPRNVKLQNQSSSMIVQEEMRPSVLISLNLQSI